MEISASLIADAVLAAFLIISYVLGSKRGFSKYIYKFAATIGSLILAFALTPMASNYIASTQVASDIYSKVHASVEEKVLQNDGENASVSKPFDLPDFIEKHMQKNGEANTRQAEEIIESTSRGVTAVLLKLIALIGMFILARVLFYLLFKILDGAAKLPVIRSVNSLSGGIIGLLQSILFVYILMCALMLLTPGEHMRTVRGIIENTYLVKFFYNNNIILKLVMKI